MINKLRKLDRIAHDREKDGWTFALNELRNLSPLILPLAEALEELQKLAQEDAEAGTRLEQPGIGEWAEAEESARAVLAKLEEALGTEEEALG